MYSVENGVSAKELERKLDVTYPTAWRMAKRIRGVLAGTEKQQEALTFDDLFQLCIFDDTRKEKATGASSKDMKPMVRSMTVGV